jgi:tetratricopeptide (TPR) repeat protein
MTVAQRAVSILERCKDADRFAVSLVTLGRLHLDEGDPARAEAMLQRALKSIENLSKENSPTEVLIFGHLGILYGRTGRHREKESYFQRAIEINRRLLGLEHPRLLDSMDAYANLLRVTKRKGEVKKLEMHVREQRGKYRRQNPAATSVVDVRSLMRQRDQ